MILALLLIVAALGCPSLVAADLEQVAALALDTARDSVPKAMKNPASAEFDAESVVAAPVDKWLRDDGLVVYRVTGTVRGTNSFNAVVPSRWTAYVVESAKSLDVSLIEYGEQMVHKGNHGLAVANAMSRDVQEKLDADKQSRKAAAKKILDQVEEGRAAAADRKELQRQSAVRQNGERAAEQAASRMGQALVRLTEKEAAKRGRQQAIQSKVPPDDVDLFVDGYLRGILAAKQALRAKRP